MSESVSVRKLVEEREEIKWRADRVAVSSAAVMFVWFVLCTFVVIGGVC